MWLVDVQCRGSELSLDECEHAGWGHGCDHRQDAGVMCGGMYMDIYLMLSTRQASVDDRSKMGIGSEYPRTTMFNMYFYNGIKRMLRDGWAGIPNLSQKL